MRTLKRLAAAGLISALTLAIAGAGVMADHSGSTTVRGVVTEFTVSANATAGATAAIGTMTIDSGTAGSMTLSVLPSTRFTLTGSDLSTDLMGVPVTVRTAQEVGGTAAMQVQADPALTAHPSKVSGTVVTSSNLSITLRTKNGFEITDALAPNVTVTLGDHQPGTLADLSAGSQVTASWEVVNGQVELIAIRIKHPEVQNTSMKGTIVAVGSNFLTLATKHGLVTETMASTMTVFLPHHRQGTFADLQAGTQVKIDAQAIGGMEEIVAVQVEQQGHH